MNLSDSNLLYREPALYDQVQADTDHEPARLCVKAVDSYGPRNARTLVDFGCGTGRDLTYLAKHFECIGVELQPGMLDYARAVRGNLDIREGDLRTFRLGYPVEVITCLGNTLSYLHDNADLRQAFATFAAHARTGTLLILHTPVAPIEKTGVRSGRVDTTDLHAEVAIRYEWDLRTQINTMHRNWKFDNGEGAHDHIRRRVLFPREIELYLTTAGFKLLEIFDSSTAPTSRLTGPSAYLIARRCRDWVSSMQEHASTDGRRLVSLAKIQ